jgi:hypothetical protein
MLVNDHVLHFILVGVGLGLGSVIKVGFDKLAEHFWDAEWKEFKKWQAGNKR